MKLSEALDAQQVDRHLPAVPARTAWDQLFEQARDALNFVAQGRALLVEGASWRVERGQGTDIIITIRQVAKAR